MTNDELRDSQTFGTDGVRGTVGQGHLTAERQVRLGACYGAYLTKTSRRATVIIGRDTRISGQMLQSALTAGLLKHRVTVIDVGVLPTPAVAVLMSKLGADGGIVISASHNPAKENGIKFFDASGTKLNEAAEKEIEREYKKDLDPGRMGGDETWDSAACGRVVEGFGLQELYLEDLIREHEDPGFEGVSVVLDCANGAASRLAPDVFGRLGCKVTAIHSSPTGININIRCGSEHVRRFPKDLSALVASYGADFGIAFDGDADRVVFVTRSGLIVDGDYILGLMGVQLAGQGKLLGNTVVTTIMRNQGLSDFLQNQGVRVLETPVGDKYVVERLLEMRTQAEGAANAVGLGGEQAGHVVLLDEQHIAGDGMRAALYFMGALAKSGAASLEEWARSLHKTPQVIASAYVGRDERRRWPRAEWPAREAEARQKVPGLTRVSIRYSGTEPMLRVMLEADESQATERLADLAHQICMSAQDLAGTTGESLEILDCAFGGLLNKEPVKE